MKFNLKFLFLFFSTMFVDTCDRKNVTLKYIKQFLTYGNEMVIFHKFNQFKNIYDGCDLKYDFINVDNLLFIPLAPILLDQHLNIQSLFVFNTDLYHIFLKNIKGIAAFVFNDTLNSHNSNFNG